MTTNLHKCSLLLAQCSTTTESMLANVMPSVWWKCSDPLIQQINSADRLSKNLAVISPCQRKYSKFDKALINGIWVVWSMRSICAVVNEGLVFSPSWKVMSQSTCNFFRIQIYEAISGKFQERGNVDMSLWAPYGLLWSHKKVTCQQLHPGTLNACHPSRVIMLGNRIIF